MENTTDYMVESVADDFRVSDLQVWMDSLLGEFDDDKVLRNTHIPGQDAYTGHIFHLSDARGSSSTVVVLAFVEGKDHVTMCLSSDVQDRQGEYVYSAVTTHRVRSYSAAWEALEKRVADVEAAISVDLPN